MSVNGNVLCNIYSSCVYLSKHKQFHWVTRYIAICSLRLKKLTFLGGFKSFFVFLSCFDPSAHAFS